MPYQWSSDLETGFPLIDAQHKALFAAVNDFSAAFQNSGKGKEEIDNTLHFLVEYALKHFADEEELQREYEYPDYARHKYYHNAFKETIAALLERYQEEGPTDAMVADIYKTTGSWLVNHIKGDDFVFAAFLHDR